MKKISFLLFITLFYITASAQHNKTDSAQRIFRYIDQMPEAPYDIQQYVGAHLKYPPKARKENMEGKVVVSFIVTITGRIDSAHVVSSYIGGGLEEEAVRIVESFPKWKPGLLDGKPVNVYYSLPLIFKIK